MADGREDPYKDTKKKRVVRSKGGISTIHDFIHTFLFFQRFPFYSSAINIQ